MAGSGRNRSQDDGVARVPRHQTQETATPQEEEEDTVSWVRRTSAKIEERASRRPAKVTPDDVLAKWSDKDGRPPRKSFSQLRQEKGRVALCGLLLAATVGTVLHMDMAQTSYDDEVREKKASISSLGSRSKTAEQKVKNIPSQTQGWKILSDLQAAGKKVATLQNGYGTANLHDGSTARTAQVLRTYFTGYTSSAASPWYSILRDPSNKFAEMKYSWEFQTPYIFGEAGQSVNVTWLCLEKPGGNVLAWTMAKYDVKTKKFVGVTYGTTRYGDSKVGAAPADEGPSSTAPSPSPSPSGSRTPPSSSISPGASAPSPSGSKSPSSRPLVRPTSTPSDSRAS